MTNGTTPNRFSAMFEKTGVTEKTRPKRPAIDFGAAMADDEGINATFRSLRNENVRVDVDDPVVTPVLVGAPSPSLEVEVSPVIVSALSVEPVNQTVSQTVNHTISQTVGQTVVQTVIQPDGQTVGLLDGYSDSSSSTQAAVRPVIQTDNQTVGRSDGRSFRQSDNQTSSQTVAHTVTQTVGQTVDVDSYAQYDAMMFSDPVRGLTKNQCLVLLYMIQQPGITQRQAITHYTGVPFGTVKDALSTLQKKGFISKPQYYCNGDYRGISYVINKSLCDDFLRKRGPEFNHPINQTVNQTVVQTVTHPVYQTVGRSDGQTVSLSSSFLEDKSTTTESLILDDPELRYWKGEGVTEKQTQTWMIEFQMSVEEIKLSLRYGRFDILERGDVNNPANWFYKILVKNSFYPRPTNYRSPIEMRAEALKEQQERDRKASQALVEVEFEKRFQAFFKKTESDVYRQLLAQVSGFTKEQGKDGRMELEIEMRDLFRAFEPSD